MLSLSALLLLASASSPLLSAAAQQPALLDADQDGLSDALEQSLLVQFAPTFMVDPHDCSKLPAEFAQNAQIPTAKAQNGTIYGQVFPAKSPAGSPSPSGLVAEIHYYHLWQSDCGPHGHPLDAEHVAVLVTASTPDIASAQWKALYWYAAAHEDTVCDVSQIARAATLHAEQKGPTVFVSPGKHASYFNETVCHAGCGADKCVNLVPLPSAAIVNLGEAAHPMNGSVFIASTAWPLLGKMTATNFPPEPIARLNQLPETEIGWFNPGRHPAQGIIANSSSTERALATSASNTTSSLGLAGSSTGAALSTAQDNTGNALQKATRSTLHALGSTARHVGKALHPQPKTAKPE
ncbi:MAG: hypothetical protein P4L26_14830 [Terracidiphilus sp.]|nr:hypothetical protein [Terracidiphilus sp.]